MIDKAVSLFHSILKFIKKHIEVFQDLLMAGFTIASRLTLCY